MYRCQLCCYGHTLKLYNDDCTANAARTKDKHQSDSEERHTRELHNDIAVPRLYLSTLYIVDRYMYLHTCNEVTRLVAMFSVSLTVTVFWQESLQRQPSFSRKMPTLHMRQLVLANASQVTPRWGRRHMKKDSTSFNFSHSNASLIQAQSRTHW